MIYRTRHNTPTARNSEFSELPNLNAAQRGDALELLRSALDTDEIRRAVLLVVETDEIRSHLAAGIAESLADRPGLARAIQSAMDDPSVRQELHAALRGTQRADGDAGS